MNGYGPFAAVPGSIITTPIARDTTRMYIYNDTVYDLLASIGQGQPDLNATTLSGDWQTVIPAMHDAFLPSNGTIGQLYLLPINIRTSSLAINGTSSVLNNVWITPLTKLDDAFQTFPAIRQQDASSQQRVIAVPIVVENRVIAPNTFIPATTPSVVFDDEIFIPSTNNLDNLIAQGALYSINLSIQNTTAGTLEYELSLYITTYIASVATQQQIPWHVWFSIPANTVLTYTFEPATPYQLEWRWTSDAPPDHLGLQLVKNTGSATASTLVWNYRITRDQWNSASPGGPGAGAIINSPTPTSLNRW